MKYKKSEIKELLLKFLHFGKSAATVINDYHWCAVELLKHFDIKLTDKEKEEIYSLFEGRINSYIRKPLSTKIISANTVINAAPYIVYANDLLELVGKDKIELSDKNLSYLTPSYDRIKYMRRKINLDVIDLAKSYTITKYGKYTSPKPKMDDVFNQSITNDVDKEIEKWMTLTMKGLKAPNVSGSISPLLNLTKLILLKENLKHIDIPENASKEMFVIDMVLRENRRDIGRKKEFFYLLTSLQRSLLAKFYEENKVEEKVLEEVN